MPAAADPLAGLADLGLTDNDDPLAGLDDLFAPAEPSPAAADPLAGLTDLGLTDNDDPLAGLDDLFAPAEPLPAAADPLAGLTDPGLNDDDDPLAGLADLLAPAVSDRAAAEDPLAGLDDLLTPEPAQPLPEDDPLAGLEELLAGVGNDPDAVEDPLAGLEALLAADPVTSVQPGDAAEDPLAGLESLLSAPDEPSAPKEDPLATLDDLLSAPGGNMTKGGFGRITAAKPTADRLNRPVFRMAVFGDFTGRAARGQIAIGDDIARRRAILLDVDTVDAVIEGLATTVVLPIGPEGKGISVSLKGLDSLHPDELVGSVDVFEALRGLRQRLSTASMAAKAVAEMQAWGGAYTTIAQPTAGRSAASSVPANLRLTDFQRLIGDREGRLSRPSPVSDLIGQIVGPYVVPGPNPEAKALRTGVDAAMSQAMRLVLHHPEFQAIEAQWRSIDLLARRIETDEKLEIMLFDISAEELGADLSAQDDLAKSGLFRLLNAPLLEEGANGFSAVFGLYAFEETPPHAALLGRMARLAEHVQAPFFTAMTAAFYDIAKRDRHPLVNKAWDDLRRDPVAKWLGLAAPRFLLRHPYGERTEPIDAFEFEEFTKAEGLSGMLWGNPVVLIAILLAEAWTQGGRKMVLGKNMSMGEMPFHFVEDQYGDQVALPCTERNVTTEKSELAVQRGFMPVVSIRGRDVVRLASFQSVAGSEIMGPWATRIPDAERTGEQATLEAVYPAGGDASGQSVDDELDALLAGFGDSAAPIDPNGIDADLAALLEGL